MGKNPPTGRFSPVSCVMAIMIKRENMHGLIRQKSPPSSGVMGLMAIFMKVENIYSVGV